MDGDLTPWIFASIMTVGVIYMMASIIVGDLFDFGGDLDLDLDVDADLDLSADTPATGDGLKIGCSAIAAFLAAFGAIGLASTLAGQNIIITLTVSTIFGLVVGRLVAELFAYLRRQQFTTVQNQESLIGLEAHATIHIAPNRIGEGMVHGTELLKYAIKEMNGVELYRGDTVQVMGIEGNHLLVKKIAGEE